MSTTHLTKDKGDQGLGFVIARFMACGIHVALPISEHLPFDLIAISTEGHLRKVSVKYRAVVQGSVELSLRSVWSNRVGVHLRYLTRGDVDAHALYCPDTERCYFIRDSEIVTRRGFKLRLTPAKIRDSRIRQADEFLDPNRIFGE